MTETITGYYGAPGIWVTRDLGHKQASGSLRGTHLIYQTPARGFTDRSIAVIFCVSGNGRGSGSEGSWGLSIKGFKGLGWELGKGLE